MLHKPNFIMCNRCTCFFYVNPTGFFFQCTIRTRTKKQSTVKWTNKHSITNITVCLVLALVPKVIHSRAASDFLSFVV